MRDIRVTAIEPDQFASEIKRRQTAKLWADTSKLHLFDPESGESLRKRDPEQAAAQA